MNILTSNTLQVPLPELEHGYALCGQGVRSMCTSVIDTGKTFLKCKLWHSKWSSNTSTVLVLVSIPNTETFCTNACKKDGIGSDIDWNITTNDTRKHWETGLNSTEIIKPK